MDSHIVLLMMGRSTSCMVEGSGPSKSENNTITTGLRSKMAGSRQWSFESVSAMSAITNDMEIKAYNVLTFIESTPSSDPRRLPDKLGIVLGHADGHHVRLELDGLVEPQKGQVVLEAGSKDCLNA